MRETGWRQKRSNKATKKGMTSIDANNVEQSAREGLSSHNRPNDLRDERFFDDAFKKGWMAQAAPPPLARSDKPGRVFTEELFNHWPLGRASQSHGARRSRPQAPSTPKTAQAAKHL